MNRQAKKYYRKLYWSFPSHTHMERKYLRQLKLFLAHYAKQYPQDTYRDYVEKIGHPQEIILAYYEKTGNQYVITQMKTTQFIHGFILVFCVFIALVVMFGVYLKYQEYQYYNQTYYYEEIIEEVE